MTTYTLQGAITGDLWWPQIPASKPVEMRWQAAEFDSLREAVQHLMRSEDGDFSTAARLTADSVLVVQRFGSHGQAHTHYVDVERCASIREDYVAADVYASDFYPDEDLVESGCGRSRADGLARLTRQATTRPTRYRPMDAPTPHRPAVLAVDRAHDWAPINASCQECLQCEAVPADP